MAIRIVLAEDEAIIRLDLRESLQEEGYEVVGDVGRGDKAVEMVEALRPDVAIFDIKMPGMSGLEAAKIVLGCRWGRATETGKLRRYGLNHLRQRGCGLSPARGFRLVGTR